MIRFHGKMIDPVALWGNFTDIPDNAKDDSPFISGLWCPNPEHNNSRMPGPFQINVIQPTVHCFAECGISGSYERAVAIIQGWENVRGEPNTYKSRKHILRLCAGHKAGDHRGMAPVRGRQHKHSVVTVAELSYSQFLPAVATEYLHGRGIDGGSIAKWELGWNGDDRRIVIPAKDDKGTTRFLIERAVRPQDQPKYLYSEGAEKTSLLFGACLLDPELVKSQGLVLVEGSFDAIMLHQHGQLNTAGQLGSKLSRRQRDIIARYRPPRIFTFFDKNAAGVRATKTAAVLLRAYPIFVCLYPRTKSDPAELSRKEVERAIRNAVPYVTFMERMPKRTRREAIFGSQK